MISVEMPVAQEVREGSRKVISIPRGRARTQEKAIAADLKQLKLVKRNRRNTQQI